jgi:uncharacterized Tic20 family protein
MVENKINSKNPSNGADDRLVFLKFGVLLFVGLLLVYAKFLWPLVFGRMEKEGISIVDAVQDVSIHAVSFTTPVICWLVVALWVYFKDKTKG